MPADGTMGIIVSNRCRASQGLLHGDARFCRAEGGGRDRLRMSAGFRFDDNADTVAEDDDGWCAQIPLAASDPTKAKTVIVLTEPWAEGLK